MNAGLKLGARRSRGEKLLYGTLAIVVAALAIDGLFGAHGLISSYRMRLQVKQREQRVQQLEEENQEFSKQVQELKTNPSVIEHVAHQRMGLVKPGQMIFKLPPSTQSGSAGSATPSSH